MVKQAVGGVVAFVLAAVLASGGLLVYKHLQLVDSLIQVLRSQPAARSAPAPEAPPVN